MRANDLPLSNDLESWPDNSVAGVLDVQSHELRAQIPLGSVIVSHFHFSFLPYPVAFTNIVYMYSIIYIYN